VRDGHRQHTGSVQVFLPRTTQLLVNLTHGQNAIEHTLQHATVHGDDRIPERGLCDAGPLRLQVEDIVASPEAFGTFGEIELIELDWAAEGIHAVLTLL